MTADATKRAVLVVGSDPAKTKPLADRLYSADAFRRVDGLDTEAEGILLGVVPPPGAADDKRKLGELASAASGGEAAAIASLAAKFRFLALVAAGATKAVAFDPKGGRRVELGDVGDPDRVIAALKAFVMPQGAPPAVPPGTTPGAPPGGPPGVAPPVLDLDEIPSPPPPPELDLAQKDQLVSAEPAIVELQSIQVRREQVRGAIAVLLIVALIGTIFLFLLGDMLDRPVDGNKLNLCITALVSLVGAAMGFYFGTEAKK